MVLQQLISLATVDFAVQCIGCLVSVLFQTEKFYDLIGSCTFVLLTCLAGIWATSDADVSVRVQCMMVLIWAGRLGLFLFVRVLKTGTDRRFDRARKSASLMLIFWLVQGVWVFITLLPTLVMVLSNRTPVPPKPPTLQQYIGWSLWLIGFITEVVADYQKTVFRNNPANQGRFISTGLWSLCRHPNYLGEIVLWFGLYLSAGARFHYRSCQLQHLLVLSPVFVAVLITRLSGVPLLEASADRRWAADPDYQRYRHTVPVLVPLIGSVSS